MTVKVADFGFSNQFSPGQRLNTWCGSPPYAAPELFQGKEYTGPEVDVWSMGVVLYVLVCGSLPFDGSNLAKLRARVISGKFKIPFYMSPDCERLIKKMLVIEPAKRATLEQVMQDKWFTEGYENEKMEITPADFTLTAEQHRTVLDELEEIGLDRNAVEKSLKDGEYDPLAATFYLVADKRFRQMQMDALPTTLASVTLAADSGLSLRKLGTGTPTTKSSKPTELSGIDEEGGANEENDGERRRNATEPPPRVAAAAPAAGSTTTPSPTVAAGPVGAATGAAGGSNVAASTPSAAVAAAARPTSTAHRRRATVNTTPMSVTEMRKEIQAQAQPQAQTQPQTQAQPDASSSASAGSPPTSTLQVLSDGTGNKELPPPRTASRAPSARSRALQMASEFKPRAAEPASAQIAAVPPGAPQLLPPIAQQSQQQQPPAQQQQSQASRARAHTLATGTARPTLDGAQQDDDQPIPIDQLKRRLADTSSTDEPRTARFTFSLNTTSTKEPDAVFAEVVRVLKEANVKHTVTGLVATCALEGIEFELEVCRLPNLAVNGLRFKRLAGNTFEYKDLLTGLISKMNL
eukprot:jgi/Hompol1/2192/HPOL_002070-RA